MNPNVDSMLAYMRTMQASAEADAEQVLAWYARLTQDPRLSPEARADLKAREREFDASQRFWREKIGSTLHDAETFVARALRSKRRSRRRSTR